MILVRLTVAVAFSSAYLPRAAGWASLPSTFARQHRHQHRHQQQLSRRHAASTTVDFPPDAQPLGNGSYGYVFEASVRGERVIAKRSKDPNCRHLAREVRRRAERRKAHSHKSRHPPPTTLYPPPLHPSTPTSPTLEPHP